MMVSPRGDRMKNCEIIFYAGFCDALAQGQDYACFALLLDRCLPMSATNLCIIKTVGRNAATVVNAIYTSLGGMGTS